MLQIDPTHTLKLRRYKFEDIPAIIKNTKEFCAEHPFYSTLEYDEERVTWVLLRHQADYDHFYCDMVEHNGEPVAGLGAMTTGYVMAKARYAMDMIQFIKKDYRSGRAFDLLIGGYLDWGRVQGLHDCKVSYTMDEKNDRLLERMLKKHGFTRFGTEFVRILGEDK